MEENEIIREKIKAKPKNNKLIHKSIITLGMAFLFGLVACFTFLALQPIISNILYPKDVIGTVITLPEDQEEMLPEQMVTEKEEVTTINMILEKEQMDYISQNITLDKNDYQRMFQSMSIYMDSLGAFVVEVVGTYSDQDVFMNVTEKENRSSGIIVAKTDTYYLLLTDYHTIKNCDNQSVIFNDGEVAKASVLNYHGAFDLAILKIDKSDMSEKAQEKEYSVCSLGASYNDKMKGNMAVAIGSPLGYFDSVGYGIITSNKHSWQYTDAEIQLLTTDIIGSSNANGFLFDMNGRVIGMIVTGKNSNDLKNTITAYGISDLKTIINYMMTHELFPYIGIYGENVPERMINEENEIPTGVYVREVAVNSPAMLSGFQKGDIIVKMDDNRVMDMEGYTTQLLKKKENDTVVITLQRQTMGVYKEMNIEVVIKEKN